MDTAQISYQKSLEAEMLNRMEKHLKKLRMYKNQPKFRASFEELKNRPGGFWGEIPAGF